MTNFAAAPSSAGTPSSLRVGVQLLIAHFLVHFSSFHNLTDPLYDPNPISNNNLTAHCVDGEGTGFDIRVGSDDVDGGTKISVRKVFEHPRYRSSTDEYDFAVVFLDESAPSDTALVGINDDNSYPRPGSTSYTMGWGDTKAKDRRVRGRRRLVDQLLIADVEVISNEECSDIKRDGESYGNEIHDDMICADTRGKDACQGDSGE